MPAAQYTDAKLPAGSLQTDQHCSGYTWSFGNTVDTPATPEKLPQFRHNRRTIFRIAAFVCPGTHFQYVLSAESSSHAEWNMQRTDLPLRLLCVLAYLHRVQAGGAAPARVRLCPIQSFLGNLAKRLLGFFTIFKIYLVSRPISPRFLLLLRH